MKSALFWVLLRKMWLRNGFCRSIAVRDTSAQLMEYCDIHNASFSGAINHRKSLNICDKLLQITNNFLEVERESLKSRLLWNSKSGGLLRQQLLMHRKKGDRKRQKKSHEAVWKCLKVYESPRAISFFLPSKIRFHFRSPSRLCGTKQKRH